MRSLVTALALAAPLAFSLPATAQVAPDSVALEASALLAPAVETGLFVEARAGGGYGGSVTGVITAAQASIGYRLPSGLSLGATAYGLTYGSETATFAFGPDVRYSRALDARTMLNLRASGSAGFASFGSKTQATGLGSLVEASATRRFGVGGGVTLAATGGAYGGISRSFALTTQSGALRGEETTADAGILAGLQAEFNALGGRFAIGPVVSLPVVSTGERFGTGGSLNNYRGSFRTPGLINYTGRRFTVSLF